MEIQDRPVDGASIGRFNKVYSSKRKKKRAECAIDEDRVHIGLFNKVYSSKRKKKRAECAIDEDRMHIGLFNKVYSSKRKKKRAECTIDEDRVHIGRFNKVYSSRRKKKAELSIMEEDKLLDLSPPPEKAHFSCKKSRRKLLILDLNGLLVDVVSCRSNWHRPDTMISGKSVYKRPFCDDFLKFCFERFEVGIWTSRTRKNMQAMLNFLMRDDICKLLFSWDQSHCSSTGFTTVENENKPLFLKELKKVWNKEVESLPWEKGDYTPSNTLLLDDSPYKSLQNPPYTAIFPWPYRFENLNDNSLGPEGDLRLYLEGLAKSDNVPCYVQKNPFGQHAITSSDPSWEFYKKVMGAL